MGRQVRRAIYGHTLTEKGPVFLMWTAKGAVGQSICIQGNAMG